MTPIVGPPSITLDRAAAWARGRKAAAVFVEEMIPALWQAGLLVGVDPAVLVAQSAKETAFGRFGGVIDAGWHNTAGIKTAAGGGNYDPAAHQQFASWEQGAQAHANHLGHAYAGLPTVGHVAPRTWRTATASWAGTIRHVEELGGRWAPNPDYGRSIVTDYLTPMQEDTMRVTWLPDILRAAGLTVVEVPGWRGRGRAMSSVRGVVWHDTVTPPRDPAIDARLLRDGHSTLPGPLSQLGLDRLGRFWLIADGRCNHNGFGLWGNNSIGIETYCGGGGVPGRIPAEAYNPAQRESAARGTAAILTHLRLTVSQGKGHRETDPDRKIDPWAVDCNALRARTADLMARPDPKEWDEMATRDEIKQAVIEAFDAAVFLAEHGGRQYIVRETTQTATWITTGTEFDKLRRAFPHKGSVDVTAEYEVIA